MINPASRGYLLLLYYIYLETMASWEEAMSQQPRSQHLRLTNTRVEQCFQNFFSL